MNVYSYVDMTRTNADGSFAVYIIVKNARGRFFVNTGMRTCGKLSDGRVFPRGDKMRQRKTTILGRYLSDVESVCLQYSVSDIGNKELKRIIQKEVFGVERKEREKTLSDYMTELSLTKKAQTAKCYMIAAKRVSEYDEKAGLRIDAEWLSRFYQWCLSRGMKVNGAGMILRNVRSTFNWARKMGYTTNYPFSEFSIVEEETLPNNLCVDDIRRLRDYPCEEWQKKYVDFFMLSFYLAGINPVDLLLMRKDALVDGHISFVRRKTNKEGSGKIRTIVLPLVDEARKIVKKYPSSEDWFLGFMDGRKDYHSFMKECNEALKKIGTKEIVPDKTGRLRKVVYHPLFPTITLYSARYSFGSIAANDLDISEQTIGQCLGHSWSRRVTARYIAHDQKRVDDAIKKVVSYVAEDAVSVPQPKTK